MAGSASAGQFTCGACGKSYAWKPDLAGKRVKCKCGQAISVPAAAPTAPATRSATNAPARSAPAKAAPTNPGPTKPTPTKPTPTKPAPTKPVKKTAPQPDPNSPPDLDDLFALADGTPTDNHAMTPAPLGATGGARCPTCGQGVDAAAVICIGCGTNLKTGKKLTTQRLTEEAGGGGAPMGAGLALAGAGAGGGSAGVIGYASAPRKRGGNDESSGELYFSPVKDLYLPAALILAGTVMMYFVVVNRYGISSPGAALLSVGVLTLINIVLTVPAVLITIKLFDGGLGPLPTAIVKMAAAAILPGALSGIIRLSIGGGVGLYASWGLSYLLTTMTYIWLLEMEYFEASVCATLTWLIQTWVGWAVLFLLLGGMLGGGGAVGGRAFSLGAGMASGGGASAGIGADGADVPEPPPIVKFKTPDGKEQVLDFKDPKSIALFSDSRALDQIKSNDAYEAREWLKAPKRSFVGYDGPESQKLVEDLYALGARQVLAGDVRNLGAAVSFEIFIELPDDKAARARLFAWAYEYDKKTTSKEDPAPVLMTEQSQKYLRIKPSGFGDDDEDEDEQ